MAALLNLFIFSAHCCFMKNTGFILTDFQSTALLKAIMETPELRLRQLTVVASKKVDLTSFCFRGYVAEAHEVP